MTARTRALLATIAFLFIASDVRAAQNNGRITGRVTREDTPLAGVQVVIQETGAAEWTTREGTYTFSALRPGTYTLILTLGEYSTKEVVSVGAGTPTVVETKVDWPLSYVETLVVEAASRQFERVIDAPAPVTRMDATEIQRWSGQGQVPRLLAVAPGLHITQSGLFDFNVNARGFNDMANRRVRTEVDGRDTSQVAVMGLTMWSTLAFGGDDMESLEFVRGAGSALYGAGAFNGVLSLRTKSPDASLGGYATVTFGELGTIRGEGRHAGRFGSWGFFKVAGGYQRSGDFARSRVDSVEYAPGTLPLEFIPLPREHLTVAYGSARVDRPFANGTRLVAEGGTTHTAGHVNTTNLGRYQNDSLHQPWARVEFTSSRWRLRGSVTGEDLDNALSLSSGVGAYEAGYNLQVSGETNRAFRRGRGRFVAGASIGRQSVDSVNPEGVRTIWPERQIVNEGSVFGQADYTFSPRLKGSAAARVEWNTLHDATLSPRVALIYGINPSHTVRFALAMAFKSPTVSETELQAPVAPPLDLSAIEDAFSPVLGGVSLGFESIPVLAVGNRNLEVEEVTGIDVGYSGVVRGRTWITVTYFYNRLSTFTSGLLPQVGTSLGRLNPDYGPYQPPAGVSPGVAAALQAVLNEALPPELVASMTNLEDGSPAFTVLSLGNFGKARTQGLEIGASTALGARFRLDASYSLFDYTLTLDAPDVPLLPNTPQHQASVGVSYGGQRFEAGVRYRHVSSFDWLSGIYAGRVEGYGVTDAHASYPITDKLRAGVDASNLFDNDHYEMFGGDLIGRRVLGRLMVSW